MVDIPRLNTILTTNYEEFGAYSKEIKKCNQNPTDYYLEEGIEKHLCSMIGCDTT